MGDYDTVDLLITLPIMVVGFIFDTFPEYPPVNQSLLNTYIPLYGRAYFSFKGANNHINMQNNITL